MRCENYIEKTEQNKEETLDEQDWWLTTTEINTETENSAGGTKNQMIQKEK